MLALMAGGLISVCHIIFSVLPLVQWLDSWQGDFFLTPHSVYGHWIGMDVSTIWPTLLYLLFPLFAALPCADSAFGISIPGIACKSFHAAKTPRSFRQVDYRFYFGRICSIGYTLV